MRLEQLQLMQTLANCGSLRAAARALSVSQPALTKALRQLEEEFGTSLVMRLPKGVRLTPAGTLVAARAATVVREIDRAREDVAWQLRHTASNVAISVSPAAAIAVLPGALARVRSRWPQVRVQVLDAVYPRAFTMLRAGEVDLSVGPLPAGGADRDLRVQPLFDVQQVLVVRPGNPLMHARTLAELQHADWVVAGPTAGPGDPAHLGFDERGLPSPMACVTCESFSTLLALLPSVDAIAIMPEVFHTAYAAPRGLVRLPIQDPLPLVTVHAAWRADSLLSAPASYLLDALEQEAAVCRRGAQANYRVPEKLNSPSVPKAES